MTTSSLWAMDPSECNLSTSGGMRGSKRGNDQLQLTFFSAGSVTVSASLLSALRICEAATLVDVFSKACIEDSGQRCVIGVERVSFPSMVDVAVPRPRLRGRGGSTHKGGLRGTSVPVELQQQCLHAFPAMLQEIAARLL